jgi:4'-phosphopantetheinyl transferase
VPTTPIDVWLVPADGAPDPAGPPYARLGLLDDDERAALDRLRVADDRRRYAVSHVLLRLALSQAAEGRVPPARWRFDRPPHGRPSVAPAGGMPRLDFSLSRSSGLAVVAVAGGDGCRVGVDAERCDRPLCCIPADVALSPAERSHLARSPSARQPEEFLTLWTLKEAYGKLRGCGICLPLERLEVAVSPGGRVRLSRTEEGVRPAKELHVESRKIRTAAGVYRASLAVQCLPGAVPRVTFHLSDTLWPDAREVPRLPGDDVAGEGSTE